MYYFSHAFPDAFPSAVIESDDALLRDGTCGRQQMHGITISTTTTKQSAKRHGIDIPLSHTRINFILDVQVKEG